MFDLDTVGGMNRAVEWTRELFERLKTGGIWMVPRSGTLVRIDHEKRTAHITEGHTPDPSLVKVIKAMGWAVVKK